MTYKDWFLIIALGAVFGASFTFNEILLEQFGPLTISAGRISLGALGCWAWLLMSRQPVHIGADRILTVALLGLFLFVIPFAILPMAQQFINSSTAGVANAMTPIVVLLLGLVLPGRQPLDLGKIAGLGLGLAGVILLVAGTSSDTQSDPRFVLLAMLAPLSYAISFRVQARLHEADTLLVCAWAMSIGAGIVGAVAIGVEGTPQVPNLRSMATFLCLGLGLTTIAFVTVCRMSIRVGAINTSLLTMIAPVSALILGVVFFDETFGALQYLGTGGVLLALAVIDGRLLQILSGRRSGAIANP